MIKFYIYKDLKHSGFHQFLKLGQYNLTLAATLDI